MAACVDSRLRGNDGRRDRPTAGGAFESDAAANAVLEPPPTATGVPRAPFKRVGNLREVHGRAADLGIDRCFHHRLP